MTKMINWTVSKTDMKLISRIVKRAVSTAKKRGIELDHRIMDMDLTACHANGTPLDLPKLLASDEFNFSHDVFGIRRHIDRETGELKDCFSPRCCQPSK